MLFRSVLYADLQDCFDLDGSGEPCAGTFGRELYSLDLSVDGASWQLVDDLTPGEGGTDGLFPIGIHGGGLIFSAYVNGLEGYYWTDGEGVTLLDEQEDNGYPGLSRGVVVGDLFYYYWGSELRRYSFSSARAASLTDCALFGYPESYGNGPPRMAAVGPVVYFACGGSDGFGGLWRVSSSDPIPREAYVPSGSLQPASPVPGRRAAISTCQSPGARFSTPPSPA